MTELKITKVEVTNRRYPRRGERWASYHAKPRVYIHLSNETVLENLENRRFRPVQLYREALKKVPQLQGKSFRWSQKAGCPCGCSPGFIVNEENTGEPYDIWVHLEGK